MAEKDAISPTIRGFLHVAIRKHLSVTPRSDRAARKKIIQEFLQVHTEEQAREYIQSVRELIREAKHSRRRTLHLSLPPKASS